MRAVKLVLKIVLTLVALLVIAAGGLYLSVFAGKPAIPGGLRLGDVEVVKDGYVSAFLIDVGPREVALVDAGNDERAGAIMAALQRRGLGPEAVTTILLTHGDVDHTKGARAFPRATVMALAADVDLAEGKVGRGPIGRPGPRGFKVGRVLRDGESLDLHGARVDVFAIAGHTPGSAAYLAKGVLFLGDSAEAERSGRLAAATWLFCSDRPRNRASLVELAQRLAPRAAEVTAIATAHSGVLSRGLAPLTELAARTRGGGSGGGSGGDSA